MMLSVELFTLAIWRDEYIGEICGMMLKFVNAQKTWRRNLCINYFFYVIAAAFWSICLCMWVFFCFALAAWKQFSMVLVDFYVLSGFFPNFFAFGCTFNSDFFPRAVCQSFIEAINLMTKFPEKML